MWAEGCLPLLALATVSSSRSRLLVVGLGAMVQLGIQMLFYLPQFACISVIASLPMLPTPVLDQLLGKSRVEEAGARGAAAVGRSGENGGDGGTGPVGSGGGSAGNPSTPTPGLLPEPSPGCGQNSAATAAERRMRRISGGRVSKGLSLFCLVYMIHLFAADTLYLFRPLDHGDIGQGIRFIQGFDMFTQRAERRNWPVVVAKAIPLLSAAAAGGAPNSGGRGTLYYDLLDLERRGGGGGGGGGMAAAISESAVDELLSVGPACISCSFLGWRYERAFCNVGKTPPISATMGLTQQAQFYCTMLRSYAKAEGSFPGLDRSKPVAIVAHHAFSIIQDPDWTKPFWEPVPPRYSKLKRKTVATGTIDCQL